MGGGNIVAVIAARAPPVPARVVATAAVYAGRGVHMIRAFEARDTALIAIIVVVEARGGQARAVAVDNRTGLRGGGRYKFGTRVVSSHL